MSARPTPTATADRAGPATTPAGRVATTTLSVIALPAVWWVFATIAVIAIAISFGLARFGVFEQGAWTGISSISRYVAGAAGLMIGSALRHLVAHGVTRRDGFRGLTVGALGLTVAAGAIIAAGAGIEWLVFAAAESVTTPVSSAVGVGVTWLAATTQLIAYLVSGALIGVAYATLPWSIAIPATVVALVPAAATEALWAAALAPADPSSGPFRALLRGALDAGATTGMLAVLACVVTAALGYLVLRRGVVHLQFPA